MNVLQRLRVFVAHYPRSDVAYGMDDGFGLIGQLEGRLRGKESFCGGWVHVLRTVCRKIDVKTRAGSLHGVLMISPR